MPMLGDMPVSQVVKDEPWFDLFGIVQFGGGSKIVTGEGFFIPKYVEDSIIAIIFFLFGTSAAKR